MPKFGQRKCEIESCSNMFTPTGPAAKFCKPCSEEKRKRSARERSYKHKLDHCLITNPGVGKGGANKAGQENAAYKNGIGFFMSIRRVIRDTRKCCERCGKDLIGVGRYGWAVHHKDHDRTNNDISNLELLCKRCHQLEHNCHKAFEGVETIRKE